MTSPKEPLPCPFCGGVELEIASSEDSELYVQCLQCHGGKMAGEANPTPDGEEEDEYGLNKEDRVQAAESWNQRASQPQAAQPEGVEFWDEEKLDEARFDGYANAFYYVSHIRALQVNLKNEKRFRDLYETNWRHAESELAALKAQPEQGHAKLREAAEYWLEQEQRRIDGLVYQTNGPEKMRAALQSSPVEPQAEADWLTREQVEWTMKEAAKGMPCQIQDPESLEMLCRMALYALKCKPSASAGD